MDKNLVRLIATFLVWGALAGMVIAGGIASGESLPFAIALAIGATVSTGIIWESAKYDAPQDDASKAKRTNRVSRLVDNLDEDEVLELGELLRARDEDQRRN